MGLQLNTGYLHIALKLQEQAADLSANDVRARLCDSLNDAFRSSGSYAYLIDYYGDADSGDVIYCVGGDTRRASYEIGGSGGTAATCTIDTENSENVVPRTVYETEADEADGYAAMQESAKRYTKCPLYERFVSKGERASMDSSDFAGKGKSFPINKPADVMAAFHSLGRAGGDNHAVSTIRANIIKIAKRKGYKLPKSAQDATEARRTRGAAGSLTLKESAITTETIVLREARADYEIKLIAPGKGSSAFYPAEVLKRDGPKVFGAGTHVYLNHPTAAEEASRPEGDVANLAGVLTTGAEYHESHPKGEGLYARMKVFADHAQTVEEKAPHVGMSIRAAGVAESGKMRDGLPVLKQLTSAESVDVVTRAGAGGMILTEAARGAQEVDVDEAGVTKLVEAAVTKAVKEAVAAATVNVPSLQQRAIRGDAREEATRLLESVTLPAASKARAIASVLIGEIPVKEGALDVGKFKPLVEAAARTEGEYITSLLGAGARPVGMGPGVAGTQIDATEVAAREEAKEKSEKKRLKESRKIYESFGLSKEAAERAAEGRVA